CGCKPRISPKRMQGEIASFRQYYSLYRTRAKREKIPMKLNKAQFFYLTQQPCFFCGKTKDKQFKPYKDVVPFVGNGVDRLDNTKGYNVKNCVPCCHSCNRSKGSVSI